MQYVLYALKREKDADEEHDEDIRNQSLRMVSSRVRKMMGVMGMTMTPTPMMMWMWMWMMMMMVMMMMMKKKKMMMMMVGCMRRGKEKGDDGCLLDRI